MLDGLRTAGVIAVALTAIIGFVGVAWKSKIGKGARWVFHRLIGEPVETWHHASMSRVIDQEIRPIVAENSDKVNAILAEFSTNGGASMRDQLNRLEAGQRKIFARLDEANARIDGVEQSVANHDE